MADKENVLSLLGSKKNVLLMGAPGTGKSKLMNEVADAFQNGISPLATPSHVPGASVPIPAVAASTGTMYPMLKKKNRKVFRTTLHQNSKYRDFITGIVPDFSAKGGYKINAGILYRANEFAMQPDSAALLIIDELNRGPAVEVFGGSIVAIESDKRLDDNGKKLPKTQFFEIEDLTGNPIEYAFSPNLYILAAMNQADSSVAPLDVAFLRRWQGYKLLPDYDVLFSIFGISKTAPVLSPTTAAEVYNLAFCALEKINERVTIGRGVDYQLGQGVFLSTQPEGAGLNDALKFVREVWAMIYAHLEELFYGDAISLAYILNAKSPNSPYSLDEVSFADETKYILNCVKISDSNICGVFNAILE